METTTKNPININISNSDEQKSDPYSKFKEYVIINNIELQKELKISIETVKQLEATVSEKEAEEDKYDNRVRYMKGLIQNLNELKTEYVYLENKENEKTKLSTKFVSSLHSIHIHNYTYCLIIFISNIIRQYITHLFNNYALIIIINLFSCIILCYSLHKLFHNYNSMKNEEKVFKNTICLINSQIKEKKAEIKKIEESTLTLDNWICEI